MEKPLESDVNSIAIKLPSGLQERILTFPFLHAISEFYPRAELHFITPKLEIEVLNLLPFKAYYHEYDEDDFQNVFDVHRFCANSRIYNNIDLFISLTDSFSDACIGLSLKAKKRVGFSDNWKSLVLTHKTPHLPGHHLVEDYFSLYQIAVGESVSKSLRVISRDLTPIIKSEDEDEPYIALNLAPLRGSTIEPEWLDLISNLENQKIILFSSEDQVRVQMVMESFMSKLPKSNTYVNFTYQSWIELGRMIAHSQGVVTYSGALGALSAYVGSKTLILFENEDPQVTGPFYFLGEVAVMGINNPTLVNSVENNKVIKDRMTFNMMEVAKKAFDFFRL